jgi:hypothetical protein
MFHHELDYVMLYMACIKLVKQQNKENEVIEAVPQNAELPKSKYRQKYRWHGGLNSLLKCYNHTVRKLLAWKFLFHHLYSIAIVAHPHKYIYTHTPHFTLLSSPSVQVTKCILQSALNIHHDGKWIKYFYVLSAYIALKIQKCIRIFYKCTNLHTFECMCTQAVQTDVCILYMHSRTYIILK